MIDKPTAPATERNRAAILEVLTAELKHAKLVLEIGSGTGQHAVYFANELPTLYWQTSDRVENHPGIVAWVEDAKLSNIGLPLALDVLQVSAVEGNFDAVFSANTAHIMGFDAVVRMFQLVGRTLSEEGVFCLYGPFNLDGEFTSSSNEAFDRSLRSQDSSMGIRDLEKLVALGVKNDLQLLRRYTMPANNMLVIWQKR